MMVAALAVLVVLGLAALLVELREPARGSASLAPRARPEGPRQRVILIVGLLLLARAAFGELADLFEAGAVRDWDLAVYYHAGPALLAGFDPYDAVQLAAASGRDDLLSCYYPPLTVAAFTPLSRVDLAIAGRALLGLKLVLLGGMIWAWTRQLGPWVVVVTAALWLYAIQIDLGSGNVSVFEQALLWAGVGALLADRRLAFAVLIACAAVFKIQLISMAALALVVDPRHGWRPVCVALGGLSAYLLIGVGAFPGPSVTWYTMAQGAALSEGGFHSPSLVAALRHLGAGSTASALAVALVLASSTWLLWRTRERPLSERLMVAILALTLAWPRLKDYSFIVLIPPAASSIARLSAHPGRWAPKLGIAAVLALLVLLTRERPDIANEDYRPTLLLLSLWLTSAALLVWPPGPQKF
ncbi:hypothetical protein ENSA5_44500 [Enhygromyxa salina]|uniref:DUF2029 domain-containing protein n=2 Tax=Enhygromyxa salina TaxID=215803 RepID=A0A2S9XK04_9BACT|nr:hypothetical protein ENSA5_44500 [Enhygromyxa salina]